MQDPMEAYEHQETLAEPYCLSPTWRHRGLSKSVISRVIIRVTPFRVLITLLITDLLSPLGPQVTSGLLKSRGALLPCEARHVWVVARRIPLREVLLLRVQGLGLRAYRV